MGNSSRTDWIDISAIELQTKLENRNTGKDVFFLLDVRNPNEAEICSIPGTDQLLPVKKLLHDQKLLQTQDKNFPLIVYCKSGIRSKEACQFLKLREYTQVFHLKGGILEYIALISPDLPVY